LRVEPEGVAPVDGVIQRVVVDVHPAELADGIGADVSADRRIIVPESVVVQPRLRIVVLPREPVVVARDRGGDSIRGSGDGCESRGEIVVVGRDLGLPILDRRNVTAVIVGEADQVAVLSN
jgi:hypothetical protein